MTTRISILFALLLAVTPLHAQSLVNPFALNVDIPPTDQLAIVTGYRVAIVGSDNAARRYDEWTINKADLVATAGVYRLPFGAHMTPLADGVYGVTVEAIAASSTVAPIVDPANIIWSLGTPLQPDGSAPLVIGGVVQAGVYVRDIRRCGAELFVRGDESTELWYHSLGGGTVELAGTVAPCGAAVASTKTYYSDRALSANTFTRLRSCSGPGTRVTPGGYTASLVRKTEGIVNLTLTARPGHQIVKVQVEIGLELFVVTLNQGGTFVAALKYVPTVPGTQKMNMQVWDDENCTDRTGNSRTVAVK